MPSLALLVGDATDPSFLASAYAAGLRVRRVDSPAEAKRLVCTQPVASVLVRDGHDLAQLSPFLCRVSPRTTLQRSGDKSAQMPCELPSQVEGAMDERGSAAPGPELAERLAALARSYAERLPARHAELLELVRSHTRLGEGPEAAIALAHRLHGTAGSHGLGDYGSAAGRLERALLLPRSEPGRPAKLERALAELCAALAGAGPGGVTRAPADDEVPARDEGRRS